LPGVPEDCYLNILGTRSTSQVGDTRPADQGSDLLASQRDGGDNSGKLTIDRALHLFLQSRCAKVVNRHTMDTDEKQQQQVHAAVDEQE
jgi:hypothetical protein